MSNQGIPEGAVFQNNLDLYLLSISAMICLSKPDNSKERNQKSLVSIEDSHLSVPLIHSLMLEEKNNHLAYTHNEQFECLYHFAEKVCKE